MPLEPQSPTLLQHSPTLLYPREALPHPDLEPKSGAAALKPPVSVQQEAKMKVEEISDDEEAASNLEEALDKELSNVFGPPDKPSSEGVGATVETQARPLEKPAAASPAEAMAAPPAESVSEALGVVLEAEANSLQASLPLPEEDPRKSQLAWKQVDKEAKEAAKKDKEDAKARKAAEKLAEKQAKEAAKAEKKKQKEAQKRTKGGRSPADVAAEPPSAHSVVPPGEVCGPPKPPAGDCSDGKVEKEKKEAAAAGSEHPGKAVPKKRRTGKQTEAGAPEDATNTPSAGSPKPAAKAKGRPRNQSPERGADTSNQPPAKKGRRTRRDAGQGVDPVLVTVIRKFMLDWRGKSYDKKSDTLHKGVPGLTPYWSRAASGLKISKADGSGTHQCCYFQMLLTKTCSMAVNLFLSLKFRDKLLGEDPSWIESDAAGRFYGLLYRSALEAHEQLEPLKSE